MEYADIYFKVFAWNGWSITVSFIQITIKWTYPFNQTRMKHKLHCEFITNISLSWDFQAITNDRFKSIEQRVLANSVGPRLLLAHPFCHPPDFVD